MASGDILAAREVTRQIFVDDKVKRYAVDLVGATRDPAAAGISELAGLIEYGASVRGSLNLVRLAKANALLAGRSYTSPHDVKSVAPDVLRHRVVVTYEAEAQGRSADDVDRCDSRQCRSALTGICTKLFMLPAEIVNQVRRIQLRTGRQVADVLAGAYVSVFKGRGVEFDEVRPYVPGDDVRTIDWNVTARMGAPYVKRYVEERQLTVLLIVDMSASLDFGSAERSKREAAVELSALLAFSAIYNDDKVGLLLFHGEVDQFIPPRKGQKHALRVVREVLARGEETSAVRPRDRALTALPRALANSFAQLRERSRGARRRSTNIAHALEFCRRVLPRRAVLFLISDFLDDGYLDALRGANRKTRRGGGARNRSPRVGVSRRGARDAGRCGDGRAAPGRHQLSRLAGSARAGRRHARRSVASLP